ncbi:hypothetical protein BpHYR1_054168 [Brachionus plicatilis]|uniref:Uncharacterized protein n=1 Tax=Brachionus plicatilis TaxID=10195 RepID=A0A3M7S1Y4_BRAPC|nr:hypothetical protein BpHYR1_054168 [Brachionus plicatilis]
MRSVYRSPIGAKFFDILVGFLGIVQLGHVQIHGFHDAGHIVQKWRARVEPVSGYVFEFFVAGQVVGMSVEQESECAGAGLFKAAALNTSLGVKDMYGFCLGAAGSGPASPLSPADFAAPFVFASLASFEDAQPILNIICISKKKYYRLKVMITKKGFLSLAASLGDAVNFLKEPSIKFVTFELEIN